MMISIASGKGGTGKTTLALLLAAEHSNITLVDCDVEEPNCHLFLHPKWQNESICDVSVTIPYIDSTLCNGCGACSAVCLFNAIAVSGKNVLLFDELCHSCGGCQLACKQNAISETAKIIGTIKTGTSTMHPSILLVSGTLKVGTPSAVPLIKRMRQETTQIKDILVDCPPGTSCSMVTAVKGSDFCILVTEPTPFGRHDLELAMNITRLLQIPTGVVINKSDADIGDRSIEDLCEKRRIPVLAKIPHSLSFAEQYSAGHIPDEFQTIAADIWRQLKPERSAEA